MINETILGIDPGLSGALAFLRSDGLVIHDMPTLTAGKKREIDEIELARLIDAAGPIDHAFLEQVGTRPGEGAVGAFAFGRGYGLIRGILRAHFVPIINVTPAKWQRDLGIKTGAGKDAARAMAKERFQHQAGLFARVKDDGRADAALIALWGNLHLEPERASVSQAPVGGHGRAGDLPDDSLPWDWGHDHGCNPVRCRRCQAARVRLQQVADMADTH
jgi:crossover junction endodeoxyribonuclease RuvC